MGNQRAASRDPADRDGRGDGDASSVRVAGGLVTITLEAAHGAVPRELWLDLRDFGLDTSFRPVGGPDSHLWRAEFARPPVDRLEYLVVWEHPNGRTSMSPDSRNPLRVPGVFGDHSVVEFDEYRPPVWLHGEAFIDGMGRAQPVGAKDPDSGVVVAGALWSPHDSTPDEPLPLLVANDGREFTEFGDLTGFLGVLGDERPGLRCRALLLHPVDRDRSYSASPAYGRLLVEHALPAVASGWATVGRPVGMGASLGAVAILEAATSHPGSFGGVLLQSGSFFDDRFDAHESGFRFYDRLVRFTADLDADPRRFDGLAVSMTCGTGEENLENNRHLRDRLEAVGVPVQFTANRDSHNYIGWRDCWDPALSDLMTRVWARAAQSE